ncbi:uncharacterized protein CXorf58 homolog isoform X1 [Oryctolagus cuniculus]|uniref:uncharacterized protein CXorf58 homolog isoform X1 n=1 Tax=Oryctolagus cuniculus TaxID=9986 RepID=UPI00039048D3|nr:uncharacterized protein CXorf58 homolog isoform X1 [Oryctolagus cuniculus]XP_008270673.1 uncharacterized protein CXorf58 homolog isoform X1 [Oryctolagus cuniculus]
MDDSSNTSGTTVPKSEKRHPGKVHFADTTETRIFLPFNTETSVRIIQRAWLAYLDKMMFRLLKHTICAVEYRVTHEILKKVSPSEAELVKDPTMKCKVRFRFSGETFPPFIVFKIFHHTEGHGCKYFSGKNMLKPCSEGVSDACKIMGKKKFYNQIMEDERLFQKFKVTDHIDIVTMKDYMQYSSLLDETPASSGGRNNYWRKLNLENIPRTMMIYDILDYAESRVISNRLQKEMKYLLQRPGTEEMRQHQLQIVSEVRYPTSFTSSPSSSRLSYLQSQCKHMGRRSKQAKIKVEKMKKAYKTGKEKPALEKLKTETPTQKPQETIILSTPSFDIVEVKESASDTELEKEEKELFTWCENLHIDKSPSS